MKSYRLASCVVCVHVAGGIQLGQQRQVLQLGQRTQPTGIQPGTGQVGGLQLQLGGTGASTSQPIGLGLGQRNNGLQLGQQNQQNMLHLGRGAQAGGLQLGQVGGQRTTVATQLPGGGLQLGLGQTSSGGLQLGQRGPLQGEFCFVYAVCEYIASYLGFPS